MLNLLTHTFHFQIEVLFGIKQQKGTSINFSNLPNKKILVNLYRGLSSYMQTHTDRQTSIVKLRDILLQLFITNMPKKILDISWKCHQTLFTVAE